MSNTLVVGRSLRGVPALAQALIERGHSVLSLAPGEAPVPDANWDHRVAHPGSAIGRGLLGDLYRQRGPFDTVIQLLDDATFDQPDPASFDRRGLDEDLQQLDAELATFLALTKSAMALTERNVKLVTLRVSSGEMPSALARGADAFMAAFSNALGSTPNLQWVHARVAAADLEAEPGARLDDWLAD